ncbi:MAG: threonine-phosphate decarboxylase [Pseudomonadota bacterium]
MIEGHGGNIYKIAQELECNPAEIVDMSSNVSPLGMPQGLEYYFREKWKEIGALPEVDSTSLRRLFAEKAGLDFDRVLTGNGTTEFIYSAPLALNMQKALIIGPTYSDYRDACDAYDVSHRFYLARKEDKYQPNAVEIEGALKGIDSVFVCNPNNPTGRLIPSKLLKELIYNHPKVRFIVDESYMPFVPDVASETLTRVDVDNLVVLHSFSKIFGIPGLRLGILTGSPELVNFFVRLKQPWSVNRLAQVAGAYLLEQGNFVVEVAQFVEKEREVFLGLIKDITELRPFPSVTNFILVELAGGMKAPEVFHKMAQEKILIRDCSNFYGLNDRFIRIALKSSEENRLCAEKLKECYERRL